MNKRINVETFVESDRKIFAIKLRNQLKDILPKDLISCSIVPSLTSSEITAFIVYTEHTKLNIERIEENPDDA